MKKNRHLDPIINQALRASFKDGKLIESQVTKLVSSFKKLSKTEAIYLVTGYLKGVRREMAFHDLVIESAVPLSAPEVSQIKKQMSSHYTLTTTRQVITADILGGVRVRVADTVYDYSLKNKIAQVKEAING